MGLRMHGVLASGMTKAEIAWEGQKARKTQNLVLMKRARGLDRHVCRRSKHQKSDKARRIALHDFFGD